MKRLLIFGLLAMLTCGVYAAVTVKPTTCTVDVSAPSPAWGDFNMNWRGYDDQTVTFVFKSGTNNYTGIDSSATTSWKMQRSASGSTNVTYMLKTTGFTVTTSNIIFSVVHTNIPPDGSYKAELQQDDGTSLRSFAKGQVNVSESLFREGGATWTNSGQWVSIGDAAYLGALTNGDATGGMLSVSKTGRVVTYGLTTSAVQAAVSPVGYLLPASTNTFSAIAALSNDWQTAYGWGNHSTNGYVTAVVTNSVVPTNDAVYLGALTNVEAGADMAVSGSGRTRTITLAVDTTLNLAGSGFTNVITATSTNFQFTVNGNTYYLP